MSRFLRRKKNAQCRLTLCHKIAHFGPCNVAIRPGAPDSRSTGSLGCGSGGSVRPCGVANPTLRATTRMRPGLDLIAVRHSPGSPLTRGRVASTWLGIQTGQRPSPIQTLAEGSCMFSVASNRNTISAIGSARSLQRSAARRSVLDAVAPLEELAVRSPNLVANHSAVFEWGGQNVVLPRYLFLGPKGGGDPIRVGLFAGIHGDEPETVHALVQFVCDLDRRPEPATGYALFVYPICNPTGFEDNTRQARSGRDLNREFWTNSAQPEVRLLESELLYHAFDGIIALHTDDTTDGAYGYARGSLLTEHLIEPALQAAARFLPRSRKSLIDGFPARDGIIADCFPGVLSGPPGVRPQPFEAILEMPQAAPSALIRGAFAAALRTILEQYSQFIAYGLNL